MRKAAYLIILIVIMTVSFGHAESIKINDGVVARDSWKAELRLLFDQREYAQLEKIASKIRKDNERFPEGVLKIGVFYRAFEKPTTESDESWMRLIAQFEEWRRTFPESVTPRVGEALVWQKYAMNARGGGYSNTVTEQGWKLYHERQEKARVLVEKPPLRGIDDHERHWLLLLLSYDGDPSMFENNFSKAIAFDPSYLPFYQQKASYLLPRYNGAPGDSIRFANEAVNLAPKNQGMIVYASIMWHLWACKEIKTFREPGVSWEKFKRGFSDLEKLYPGSRWNLNWFCRLACIAGDIETAQLLFKRIGSQPYIEAWGNRSKFEEWRRWANQGNLQRSDLRT